ncbi:hypothetical protein RND81_13G117100 [Saponaria officinalis]|uniref:Dof-type domain-containing protein n=1 Tax=Saponaria officinalis TaxID=3572 RepID=A0AAW1GZK0_SAPOF
MLDPTNITLFGKIIQVNCQLEIEVESEDSTPCITEFHAHKFDYHEDELDKELTEQESMENDDPNVCSEETMDESTNAAAAISEITDQTDKPSNDTDKQLKKPDKILPCPRCNSLDTKFCYYNNYNVNQPRHFCRNCQRYWTAGGHMRNVPVGAGRRKNKTFAPRYCHVMVSEALQADVGIKNNGTVLSFGSDYPICDSRVVENGDDRSSGSTVTAGSMEDQSKQQFHGFNNQMQQQMQCFQWPYMWTPAFPMPIYPHPYWNGHRVPTQINSVSNPNSPTLGKHTRDGEIKSPSHNNKISRTTKTTATSTSPSTVLIPKTLRIDDPDEAAKSSIWTTLGIKKDKGDPNVRNGFFNSLKSKGEKKNDCEVENTAALFKANPVALCRSFSFQEKT